MTGAFWGRTVTDLSEQKDLRHEMIANLRDQGHQPAVVADAVLVVTELITNAFQHSNAQQVRVTTNTDRQRLTITVRYPHTNDEARRIPLPPDMPGPASIRGRGLAIVDALTTSVTSATSRDHTQTTAILDTRNR